MSRGTKGRRGFWAGGVLAALALGLCVPESSSSMPLIGASNPEAVRLLIAAGANVNEESSDGLLPLRGAVRAGNESVVRMLLQAGADPLRRPKRSQLGDLSNAMEVATEIAASKKASPAAANILEMLKAAISGKGH